MFSRIQTTKSTENISDNIEKLKEKIRTADAVVIGAGAGLSTSAGFTYSGERFEKYFSDFEKKYGFHDMYTGGFCQFGSMAEYWGVLEQVYIHKQVYGVSKACLQRSSGTCKNKDYFVITTNVDHCFQKAGFFTLREITVFSCAAGRAIKQHMIMKKQSAS